MGNKPSDKIISKLHDLESQVAYAHDLIDLISDYLAFISPDDKDLDKAKGNTVSSLFILSSFMNNTYDEMECMTSFISRKNLFNNISEEEFEAFFKENKPSFKL